MKKIVGDIWDFWVITWRESQTLFWTEAIATTSSVCASIVLAVKSPYPPLLIVFSLYLVGSILLMYAMYVRKSSWMMVLMTWYSLMNVVGLYNVL
jgi:hypothetical protein|tara:strand:+ start:451 stop:735 length:285 start_codon:yes stop_codon:yes gene_type:complete